MARIEREKHICRDCRHSYAHHERDHKGEFFLCKCRRREWSQFLDIPQVCKDFETINR